MIKSPMESVAAAVLQQFGSEAIAFVERQIRMDEGGDERRARWQEVHTCLLASAAKRSFRKMSITNKGIDL